MGSFLVKIVKLEQRIRTLEAKVVKATERETAAVRALNAATIEASGNPCAKAERAERDLEQARRARMALAAEIEASSRTLRALRAEQATANEQAAREAAVIEARIVAQKEAERVREVERVRTAETVREVVTVGAGRTYVRGGVAVKERPIVTTVAAPPPPGGRGGGRIATIADPEPMFNPGAGWFFLILLIIAVAIGYFAFGKG